MEINRREDNGTVFFDVTGRIDTNTAPVLENALLEYINGEKASFKLNIAGVVYVSSAGLRALLNAQKKSLAARIQMTLTGVSKQVLEIFDITGFSGVLSIE